MSRIKLKESSEMKRKRLNAILCIGLVVIMIFSVVGYGIMNTGSGDNETDSETEINYHGLEFDLGGDKLWHMNIQGISFTMIYNPLETENISLDMNVSLEEYYNKPLYFILSDEKEQISAIEIGKNLNPFIERWQFACLEGRQDLECKENYPIKNCTDNVIIIDSKISGGDKKVYKQEQCIFIEYGNETPRAADALLYKIIGIQ